MVASMLRQLCSKACKIGNPDGKTTDTSTRGIIFMACLCAILPLDISQLSFAIMGAVLYVLLQQPSKIAAKKRLDSKVAPYKKIEFRSTKPKTRPASPPAKPVQPRSNSPETRMASVQPVLAPTFVNQGWDGEVEELVQQIMPTVEDEQILQKLAQIVSQHVNVCYADSEVNGFMNASLTAGARKAFGVAVPEVDIVANISPQRLFECIHGNNRHSKALDDRKMLKTALRTCTDRLVSQAGFRFRRSAFGGKDPKVTLLVPVSVGLFSESIAIDFSINVVTPLYNAALVAECSRMDGRAKELILLVKRWAKDRGICHAAKGHLSPYMWGLLTMYYLQVGRENEEPMLPPLGQFELRASISAQSSGKEGASDKKEVPKAADSDASAGVLFKDFMHFFATKFDWKKEAVSIRAAKRAPPSMKLPLHIVVDPSNAESNVAPSIEDPFNESQNLADNMTSSTFARLKEELTRADTLCQKDASLSELLEPWSPPEAPDANENDEPSSPAKESPKKEVKSIAASAPWRRSSASAAASAA